MGCIAEVIELKFNIMFASMRIIRGQQCLLGDLKCLKSDRNRTRRRYFNGDHSHKVASNSRQFQGSYCEDKKMRR